MAGCSLVLLSSVISPLNLLLVGVANNGFFLVWATGFYGVFGGMGFGAFFGRDCLGFTRLIFLTMNKTD